MRLRQQNPFNYMSSEKINAEFENVIRYINSAEFGDKTISELFDVLFDEQTGVFDGPIEFMFDGTKGLMWRIGEYKDPTTGWTVIATPDQLRGAPGEDLGAIGSPLYYNRQDTTPANGATVVAYPGIDSATDDILVYLNGLLQPMVGTYTVDFTAKTVTFVTPFDGTTKLTMICVRNPVDTAYRREDQIAFAGQQIFSFPTSEGDDILAYRNGILQRQGGSFDFVVDPRPEADTILFNAPMSAGDKMSFIVAGSPDITRVRGLMTTEVYAPEGLIPYNKLSIPDDSIPGNKVIGLTVHLASGVTMHVGPAEPVDPDTTILWLNTAVTPNQLNFYDGAHWISASPAITIPGFDISNAGEYLRVNATATGFEYSGVDFSSLIPKTQKGQPNGVATLDASGFIPDGQVSPQRSYISMPFETVAIGTTTGLINEDVLYMQTIRVEGVSVMLETGGTCSAQLSVDGVPVGPVIAVTTTKQDIPLSPMIQIDATTVSKRLGWWISSPAGTPGKMIGCFAISTLVAN